MKAKHRILAAGMAAAMTLSLAACGGSASTAEPTASSAVETVTPEATSEAASGDVTEVTWWTYFGDKNIGYLQNIIDDFNNSQNQYHVTIVYQGNQMECNAKLQSTEKENLPAMFSGAVEDVAMYANSDFCVPLQKYVDADTEGWQELDDTWDALRSAYSDGQGNLIGYPIGYSYPNIFYNADLLKKAGVDPASIQSFDDLYDASKTIVDGGFATYGIGFFANGAMFNVALGREGVQAYNNENGLNGQPVTECLYDSDTTVHDSIYNMLSIYQKMGAEKLCVPYGADYQSEIIPQMASGDCAMMMGVISMTTKVLDAAAGNFEVGVIPMPSASESGKRTASPLRVPAPMSATMATKKLCRVPMSSSSLPPPVNRQATSLPLPVISHRTRRLTTALPIRPTARKPSPASRSSTILWLSPILPLPIRMLPSPMRCAMQTRLRWKRLLPILRRTSIP